MKSPSFEDKGPWYLLKDTRGGRSLSFSLVIYSFFAVLLWFTISFMNIHIKDWKPMPFDASGAMAFLSPTLLNYWGRRKTESDNASKTEPSSSPPA